MIRILIVHEVRFIRDLIADVLRDEPDIEVIGYSSEIGEAMGAIGPNCDILLVNMGTPENGALELVRTVSKTYPKIRILVMGVGGAKETILKALEAGAVGYVLREDSLDELVERVRAAYSGQALLSPEIAGALVERLAELIDRCNGNRVDMRQFANLTPREYEVLGLLAEGLSNQEIAERLVIELGTVKNHVHNILKKLEASNRYQAAEYLNRRVLVQ